MSVRFTSDSSRTGAGFVGNWNSTRIDGRPSETFCSLCPAGKPPSPQPHSRPHPSRVQCGDTRLHL
jgi:hypothetical protein